MIERFDIVDYMGHPTGITAVKGSALQAGQYYTGVHIYIYNSRLEFLLQQRALDKEFLPGGWDIHMGHVIAGETPRESATRELNEELGLQIDSHKLQFIDFFVWDEYHHLIAIFFLHYDQSPETFTLQQEEVLAVRYIPCAEMQALVQQMHYRPLKYRKIISTQLQRIPKPEHIQ